MKEKTTVFNEDGTEFAYFDENPREDPWLTCPKCEGSGQLDYDDREGNEMKWPCNFCNGKGMTK